MCKVYIIKHAGGEYEDHFDYNLCLLFVESIAETHIEILNGYLRKNEYEKASKYATKLYNKAYRGTPSGTGFVHCSEYDDNYFYLETANILEK